MNVWKWSPYRDRLRVRDGEFRGYVQPRRGASRRAAGCPVRRSGGGSRLRQDVEGILRADPHRGGHRRAAEGPRRASGPRGHARRPRDEGAGRGGGRSARPRLPELELAVKLSAAAEGRGRRAQRHPRGARRHRRRRGGAVRGRSVPHVPALCGAARLAVRDRSTCRRPASAGSRKRPPRSPGAACSPA